MFPVCEDRKHAKPNLTRIRENIKKALRDLNVEFEVDEREDMTDFSLGYQSAPFGLRLATKPYVHLEVYLWDIAYADNGKLDVVRQVCNDTTHHSFTMTFFYYHHPNDCTVQVGIKTYLNPYLDAKTLKKSLAEVFRQCFDEAHDFEVTLETEIRKDDESELGDSEYRRFHDYRLWSMMVDAEKWHDKDHIKAEKAGQLPKPITVRELIEKQHILPEGCVLLNIQAEAERYFFNTSQEEEIWDYPLHTPLWHPREDDPEKLSDEPIAYIRIFYFHKNMDEKPGETHLLLITLENEGKTKTTKFFRLTYVASQASLGNSKARCIKESWTQPPTGALFLGYDVLTDAQFKAEFRYMWQDAQDKAAEGRKGEWTEVQKQIYEVSRPDEAFSLYWGLRYFDQERYFEGVRHMEHCWNIMSQRMWKFKDNELASFLHLSYQLAIGFFELGQFRTACYFIDFTEGAGNIAYSTERINCLIAAGDGRANYAVDKALSEVSEQIEQMEEDEVEVRKPLRDFHNFLRRREIYLLIEKQKLDKAEAKCQQMLDEPDNADYALNELNHIKQIREEKAHNPGRKTPNRTE